MAQDPFDRSFQPRTGAAEVLESGIRRVVAPNTGPMTFTGTNSYLIGQEVVGLIDPGPVDDRHEAALLAAIGDGVVSHVLVTHSHVDHAPMARRMADRFDAPVLAFGTASEARSSRMAVLAEEGELGGAEGIDFAFAPDERLPDGALVVGEGWTIEAIHTPGHLSDHLCFAVAGTGVTPGAVLTGDHVMGWATTMVSPPDGDLTDFMVSLDKMAARNDRIFYPGHGGAVSNPAAMIAWQKDHRNARERQIREALATGAATPTELAQRIYTDVDPRLIPAAARNVLAHLIDLSDRGIVKPVGQLSAAGAFVLA